MRRANGRPLRLLLLDTALAVGQRGQLLMLQGKIEDGIPLLRQALKELHAQQYEMLNMDFICELAACLVTTGDHGTALALIVNAGC